MRQVLWAAVLVIACMPPLHAQDEPTIDNEPTVDIVRPDYRYDSTVSSLRAIDFRNLDYHFFWKNPDTREVREELFASLHYGKFEAKSDIGADIVDLYWVQFIDEPQQYAVVSLGWNSIGGSSSPSGVIQVFTLRDQHLTVVQQLDFNTRGCRGAEATFDDTHRVLTIIGVHGWEHCCPKTLDVVTYKWAGSSFEQQSAKPVPMTNAVCR